MAVRRDFYFGAGVRSDECEHRGGVHVICQTCGVARIVMVTETVTIWRRTVTVVLCMRCWLKEFGA